MDRLFSPELMPLTLVGLGLVSLLIIVVVVMILRNSGRDDVSERLSEFAGRGGPAKTPEQNAREAIERIDEVVSRSKQGGNMARDLARADMKLTVAEFIGIKLLCALAGAGIAAFV